MLEIQRVSLLKPRYAVRDDEGHSGIWERRRLSEAVTGEIDGASFEMRRDGRRRFTLVSGVSVLGTADAARRGRWTIAVGGSDYELGRKSAWRSEMELRRGGVALGSVRKGRRGRPTVICALPAELSPAVQAFIGFIVMILWSRAAAAAGAAAG